LGQQLAGGGADGLPPVLRVLFCPAGLGIICSVCVEGAASQLAIRLYR
jgi:hypothetical protein